MKVKYRQLFSNDCGLYAIKNLLFLYGMKEDNLNMNLSENGINIKDMCKTLQKYFYEVNAISFDIYELKKVKNFIPYITIIKQDEISHYVVIYKKTNKYLYILDSARKRTYKLTYDEFLKYDANQSIIIDNIKTIFLKPSNYFNIALLTFLSLIEALFLLSTTILLQQIIDNGFNNAIIFFVIQLLLLLITTYKIKSFLKAFKKIDQEIVNKTMLGIYNLNSKYVKSHNMDEIYYRVFDAYTYKNMNLELVFNLINDILLSLLAIILLFVYSYILAIFILLTLIPVILISLKIFKKDQMIVEEKRNKEYFFINTYRDSINKKDAFKNKEHMHKSLKAIKEYQKCDYKYECLANGKNMILLYYQTIIICIIVTFYFTKLYSFISVGSLVAIINLVSLMLQPTLNICSKITFFSNMNLIKERIIDLNKNIQ